MSDTSETNDQSGQENVEPATPGSSSAWSLMGTANLESKLKIAIVYHYDTAFQGAREDRATVRRLMWCVQWYMDRHMERLTMHDLLRFHDALGSLPQADADLDRATKEVFDCWHKRLLAHDARTNARPPSASALAEVPTPTLMNIAEMLQSELKRRGVSPD